MNKADDAIASEWQVQSQRLARAEPGEKQRPRNRHQSNPASLRCGNASYKIAKSPWLRMRNSDRRGVHMIKFAANGAQSGLPQRFLVQQILRGKPASDHWQNAAVLYLPPDAAKDAARLVAKDQPKTKNSICASMEKVLNLELGFSVRGAASFKSADARDKDNTLNSSGQSRIEERG